MQKINRIFGFCLLIITPLNQRLHTMDNRNMRTFKQEKLWRDKLPELMHKQGSSIHLKPLDDNEFDQELRIKLLEEAAEVKAAQTTHDLTQELADVYEVIDTLAELHGITKEAILAAQEQKRNERGGFTGRTYVTVAEHPVGSFGEKYCLADPEKYPEIL